MCRCLARPTMSGMSTLVNGAAVRADSTSVVRLSIFVAGGLMLISGPDLCEAIRRVHAGDVYFSPRLAVFVLNTLRGRRRTGR
jgi:hypothetical protein